MAATLVADDGVVEQIAQDETDQALDVGKLPRRQRGDDDLREAILVCAWRFSLAADAVVVTGQVTRFRSGGEQSTHRDEVLSLLQVLFRESPHSLDQFDGDLHTKRHAGSLCLDFTDSCAQK